MLELEQLVEDVKLDEIDFNVLRLINWSIHGDILRVVCTQDVELEDHYFCNLKGEEAIAESVEFTVDCTVFYRIREEDVIRGEEITISNGDIAFNQITDLKVETNESFDEREFIKDLMIEVSDTGTHPSIFMPIPDAIVKFAKA